MKPFILILFVALSSLYADIFVQNDRLKRTLNLGNYFESPSGSTWNVPLEDQDVVNIAQKGFTAIRLPVRWSDYLDKDLRIDPTFLAKITAVVDKANSLGLAVVMDDHHFDSLFANFTVYRNHSIEIWKQLSVHFAKYPDSLLFFEPLNEPHGEVTSDKWNLLFADQLIEIRKTNPTRPVVMGTTEWGGINGLYSLKVPNDPNIIVTVHYYSPFQFTHQGASWTTGADAWLGTPWLGTAADKKALINDIDAVVDWGKAHNRPVFVGEFGSYEKAGMEHRLRWTHFMARLFESRKLPWAYWEYSSGFGIFDKKLSQWKPLADTLLSFDTTTLIIKEDDVTFGEELIVNGEFSSGKSNWVFGTWDAGAKATSDFTKNQFDLVVSAVTSRPYNIQLLQNGISLSAGKEYRLRFDFSTTDSFSISSGLMRTDYTSVASGSLKRITNKASTYEATFSVAKDEPNLSCLLNLGHQAGSVAIDKISLREIIPTTAIMEKKIHGKPFSVVVVHDQITFSQSLPVQSEMKIYSVKGQELFKGTVQGTTAQLPNLVSGWYGVEVRSAFGNRYTSSFVR